MYAGMYAGMCAGMYAGMYAGLGQLGMHLGRQLRIEPATAECVLLLHSLTCLYHPSALAWWLRAHVTPRHCLITIRLLLAYTKVILDIICAISMCK